MIWVNKSALSLGAAVLRERDTDESSAIGVKDI
jgi:hypothetical protein